MDFYGEINLRQNAMQQMVVQTETNFPETPVVGRVVFKDAKLYMCVAINNLIPVWLPLTNKIDTYVHSEAVASTTWTVNHGMNTTIPLIQVYDEEGEMLIPESATPLDNNNMTITFNVAVAGTAIVLFGNLITQSGVGLLEPNYTFILSNVIDNPNAYGTSADDKFGASISQSDNYIVIGCPDEDDAIANNAGKVYIFDSSTFALLQTLDNPDTSGTSDNFGFKVSTTDTYTAVTCLRYDDGGDFDSGIVYVYNPSTGALLTTIHNPNAYGTKVSDWFGYGLDITDTYLVASAINEDEGAGIPDVNSGKVYIFDISNGNLLNTIDNPNVYNTPRYDSFGYDIAITNNYVLVATQWEGDADGSTVYMFNISTGATIHTIANPNAFGTGKNDGFGISISLTDTYFAIGAYNEDEVGFTSSGVVYVFDTITGSLLQTIANPNVSGDSGNDFFGTEVSLDGNILAVSTPTEDDGGNDSGTVYVFNPSSGALIDTIDNPNDYGTPANDYFGGGYAGIDVFNSKIAISGYREDDAGGLDSGKVYIFSL